MWEARCGPDTAVVMHQKVEKIEVDKNGRECVQHVVGTKVGGVEREMSSWRAPGAEIWPKLCGTTGFLRRGGAARVAEFAAEVERGEAVEMEMGEA